jgi:ATP-dependent RNA helicase DHX29
MLDDVASSQTARLSSFTMLTVATPDDSQSKAYISTVALFQIFSTSVREEKAYTRLPTAFKDLYSSFITQKQRETDAADLANFKHLRELVRESKGPDDDEDEKEDVVLTRNFKQRNNESGKNSSRTDDNLDAAKRAQQLKDTWAHKSSTQAFQRMYQFRQQLPMHKFKAEALSIIEQNQITILCGETGM